MPFLVPLIPLIIGAAGVGLSAYEMTKGSGSGGAANGQAQLDQENKRLQAQQEQDKKAAMMRAAPDAQAQTGGALTPDSFAQMIAQMTGNPGDGGVAKSVFGGNSMGLSDAYSSLSSGSGHGDGLSGGVVSGAGGGGGQLGSGQFSLTEPYN